MTPEDEIDRLKRMLDESRHTGLRLWHRAEAWKDALQTISARTTDPTTKALAAQALLAH